jgi:hypothetical protein
VTSLVFSCSVSQRMQSSSIFWFSSLLSVSSLVFCLVRTVFCLAAFSSFP